MEDKQRNIALKAGVKNNDINTVQRLLDEGANPNYKTGSKNSLIRLAMKKNDVEMIKLLVKYGAQVKLSLIKYIFDSALDQAKELLTHIITHNKDEDEKNEILQMVICKLVEKCNPEDDPNSIDILKLLLDHELPINSFIDFDYYAIEPYYHETEGVEELTPLHLSIMYDRYLFTFQLLQHGANIHEKTSIGNSCLTLAAIHNSSKTIINLLLRNGAEINERQLKGKTVLHNICESFLPDQEIVIMLLENGADINSLDDEGNTPLNCSTFSSWDVLIEELAKRKTENQYICSENIKLLSENKYFQKTFEECLDEIKKMKDCKLNNEFSMYDILRRKQLKKIVFLTRDENFAALYKSLKKQFKHYEYSLDITVYICFGLSQILQFEQGKLFSIFKDHLPELVVRKIAYFELENFFYIQN